MNPSEENFLNNLLSAFRFAALPARTNSFRAEVKAFLQSSFEPMPADIRARSWMGFNAAFSKKLAARGWVGVTLPAQYGGASLDAFSRFVLVEELLAAGAPVSAHWIADRQSGPLILKFGTEAQRQFYLPKICAAEAFFCIGMSEPNAGSDLASVGTRATRCQIDGSSGWRLNGRKIWTTNAQHCHYMIALVRSSGEPQDRQKGLSQFIVDLALPGVTVRPIRDLAGDAHFSEVFFDNVLLTDDALIGHEGSGCAQDNGGLGPCRHHRAFRHAPGHAAQHVDRRHGQARQRGQPVGRSGPGQGHWHRIRAEHSLCDRSRPRHGPGRPGRCRVVPRRGLCEPDGAHLFPARRHARDPARHDRARSGSALKKKAFHVCTSD